MKLEDKRRERWTFVFEFFQRIWYVSPIFTYILIPVRFRKLKSILETTVKGKRNSHSWWEIVEGLGLFRLKKRKPRNLWYLFILIKVYQVKRDMASGLLQTLTFATTEWMFHEGRFWFNISNSFLIEYSKDVMSCLES